MSVNKNWLIIPVFTVKMRGVRAKTRITKQRYDYFLTKANYFAIISEINHFFAQSRDFGRNGTCKKVQKTGGASDVDPIMARQ